MLTFRCELRDRFNNSQYVGETENYFGKFDGKR